MGELLESLRDKELQIAVHDEVVNVPEVGACHWQMPLGIAYGRLPRTQVLRVTCLLVSYNRGLRELGQA